jgi:SAM-dependent methyltransferase
VLRECVRCGHLHRDLTAAPARHRSAAYGGEASLDRARLRLTHRLLTRDGHPGSVFEIGYGSGALLRMFHDDGARIGGVDPDQLRVGLDPVVAAHGDLHRGRVEDLVDGAVAADLVIGIHVLEHVDDPGRTLEAALRVTRPGGRAVFLTPAGDSLGPTLHGSAWWMLEDPTHVRFFTADSLARAARAAGWSHVRVDRPVLDSLATDAASVARRLPGRQRDGGVLSSRGALVGAAVSAPLAAVARVAVPRLRPTLRLTAFRRPDAS